MGDIVFPTTPRGAGRVLRLPNGLAIENPDGFLAKIREAIVNRS